MANQEQRSDGYTAIEDRYSGYTVNDRDGSKIGKVDDLFVDENDQPEYFGVKMGFLGSSSTLIPADIATVDDSREFIEVATDKNTAKNGPAFDDDREITPEYENEVRSYYGLGPLEGSEDRGSYSEYDGEASDGHTGSGTTDSATSGTVGAGMSMGDTESGEFREHDSGDEGVGQSRGSDLEDEDELRVQRSEEELRAGTREREAGKMKVRKRVRTEREQIEVPTRHEEVSVERKPMSGEATEAQIGEDEVSVPVTEDEVVTDKKTVAKEEVRLRKDSVSGSETVSDGVRKEEVDIEDDTERGKGLDNDGKNRKS